MHEMGPQVPKHYIFGDHFNLKNARKLRWYYNFTWRGLNSQEIVNSFQFSSRTHSWNKIHNFLWIRSTSGKMMMSYVF